MSLRPALAQSIPVAPYAWRIGPLGIVLLMHVALFFLLRQGLHQQVSVTALKEVTAVLLSSQPTPAANPQSLPLPHKVSPPVKPAVAPKAPAPVVPDAPTAVAPPTPTASAEPVAPAQSSIAASSAPETPSPPVQPKTITSKVQYIQAPQPEYPALARRMGEEGTVMLRILVNERGHAERIDMQKSSGFSRLDEAAKQAVTRALFKPYIEDGKAIAVYATVPITFQLD